jgi:hypothetical protein
VFGWVEGFGGLDSNICSIPFGITQEDEVAKKQKTEQFGVKFPDGQVAWEGENSFFRLRDARERAEFVAERDRKLREAGVSGDPGVVFLRRFRVVTHTEPEIVY